MKMSQQAHGALDKIIGSILRTYGMEALLTSTIHEIQEIGEFENNQYVIALKDNLEKALTQYQARYQRN